MDTNTVVWAIGLPLFLFFVAVGVGTVFAMTSSDSAGFIVAKACLAAAAFVFIAMAVFWAIATRQVLPWNVAIPTVAALIAVPALVLSLQWAGYREIWLSTRLFPGNGPIPSIPAGANIPPNALKVFLGSNLAWATRMPHTVLKIMDDKMIEIDRDTQKNELIISSLKIFDDRNDIIAKIDEDGFWVENSTRKKRPDPSTLVVFDHNDAEVLRIVFLDPTTISVTGVFRHRAIRRPVVITQQSMDMVGAVVSNSIMAESGIADIYIGPRP